MDVTAQDVRAVVQTATDAVRKHLAGFQPRVALILGSGLGSLADDVQSAIRIPQSAIPGFPEPGVAGHKGDLVAGTLEGVPVIAQSGRFHLYEGHPPATVVLPVRVFAELGVTTLVVTNAAGGIRPTLPVGGLMLIADHINLTGRSPLAGPAVDGEPRFPDMSEPYDRGLRALARRMALERRVPLDEGVYCGLLGPSYETPAEIRMLERLGADAVGMSTVHEVIVARARGVRCLGISTITNVWAGAAPQPLSHEEVLEVGGRAARALGDLIRGVLRAL
jgi:purine-nucleoside phosphorylase